MPPRSPRTLRAFEAEGVHSDTPRRPVGQGDTSGPASGRVLESTVEMPIYEYECHDCRRRVSLLVLRPSTAPPPTCPRCGSASLDRVMSRFSTVKSEEARLDALADSGSLGDVDENDPASVARFMKKMGREFGDELGDDFESAMDEAMAEGEGGETGGGGDVESPSASDASDE
jgi:putative FmdB family regulatory protein